ncbi:MAG: carboxypeptidase-like regulatory domain-containing protein [Cyclobacteriaceae bacterium]
MTKLYLYLIFLVAFGISCTQASAQNQRRIIQLSGVVIGHDEDADDVYQLPGVHIYVPKAGRGTTTNPYGFFSMPVLVGDSIVISSVGYERQHYIVPDHPSEYLTIVIEMVQDVTYLKEIEIMPFPTEEVFKEAILALNIPVDNGKIDKRNLNQELLALMVKTSPMDGPMNQRYYLDQWAIAQGQQYAPITNPYLNVFNWAKFFKSLKQTKKK